MAASNIVLYGCFFAAYSSVVTHTLLYHRKEIVNGFKTAYKSIRAGQAGNLAFKVCLPLASPPPPRGRF